MARITPSPLVSAISGTLGGINFAAPGSHPYVRSSRTWTNPRTPSQQEQRAQVQRLRAAWEALTDAERTQWGRAASQIRHRDRLSAVKAYTARQLFFLTNAPAAARALGIQDTPPLTTPIPTPPWDSFTVAPIAPLPITFGTGSFPSGTYYSIFLARSHRTICPRKFRGWRWVRNFSAAGVLPVVNLFSEAEATLGTPASGEWWAFRACTCVPGYMPSPWTYGTAQCS